MGPSTNIDGELNIIEAGDFAYKLQWGLCLATITLTGKSN